MALPGLMFCILPVAGLGLRQSWHIAALWGGALAFTAWLRSWWFRGFFLLVLLQVVLHPLMVAAYLQLGTIAVFLAAAQRMSALRTAEVLPWIRRAAWLLLGWVVLQRFELVGTFDLGIMSAGPFNLNAASVFFAICLPAFLPAYTDINPRAGHKGPDMGLMAVLAGLVLCQSATGIFAAVAAIGVYVCLSEMPARLKAVAIVVALASLVPFLLVVDLGNLATASRWHAWKRIVMTLPDAPQGNGLGSFAELYPVITGGDRQLHNMTGEMVDGQPALRLENGPVWRHAHNEYLQAAFEVGLAALLLILTYLASFFRRSWRQRKYLSGNERAVVAGVAALAVACCGFHPLHIAPVALIGCAWLGLAQKF